MCVSLGGGAVFPGGVGVIPTGVDGEERGREAVETARAFEEDDNTALTDGSRLESGDVAGDLRR